MLETNGLIDFVNVNRGHTEKEPEWSTESSRFTGCASAPHLDFAGEVREAHKLAVMHAAKIDDVATARFADSRRQA